MINLLKNEIFKLFHNWVWVIVIIGGLLVITVVGNPAIFETEDDYTLEDYLTGDYEYLWKQSNEYLKYKSYENAYNARYNYYYYKLLSNYEIGSFDFYLAEKYSTSYVECLARNDIYKDNSNCDSIHDDFKYTMEHTTLEDIYREEKNAEKDFINSVYDHYFNNEDSDNTFYDDLAYYQVWDKYLDEKYDFLLDNNIVPSDTNNDYLVVSYYYDALISYEYYMNNDGSASDSELLFSTSQYNYYKYLKDNKLYDKLDIDTDYVYTISLIILLAVVFYLVVSIAFSFGEEFKKGTVKLLLVKPYSRTKILFSKLLAASIFGLLLFTVMCVLSAIILSVSGYANYLFDVVITNLSNGEVIVINLFSHSYLLLLSYLPLIIFIMLLSVLVVLITYRDFIALITGFGYAIASICYYNLFAGGETLKTYLNSKFIAFHPLLCFNTSDLMYGGTVSIYDVIKDMWFEVKYFTLTNCLIASAIYILVIGILTVFVFKKKDINVQ